MILLEGDPDFDFELLLIFLIDGPCLFKKLPPLLKCEVELAVELPVGPERADLDGLAFLRGRLGEMGASESELLVSVGE